jgi:hypothetical protein
MSRCRCHVPFEAHAADLRNCRSEALTGVNQPRPRVAGRITDMGDAAGVGWTRHGERLVYDNRWVRVGLVDVERPAGARATTSCTWTRSRSPWSLTSISGC